MELDGAVSLITGGAKGLGLAISTYLHARGAQVVVVDMDEEALTNLPDDIERHALNVTHPDAVKAAIKSIVEQHGHIDILVNNAGVIHSEPMVDITNPSQMIHQYESFRRSITANLDSVFIMTSAIVEQMVRKRTKGAIVNISSIAAIGNEGQTAYSAAKAGVNSMTVTWAKELGKLGIRCNAIAPGFIDTASTQGALNDSIKQYVQSNTPLRRLGDAENVAQAVASVITNDFVNGAIVRVDGGLRI